MQTQSNLQRNIDISSSGYLRSKMKGMINPLKGEQMTFTEQKCIKKMKDMKIWNAGSQKSNLERIDSMVESVYNSEKNAEY